MKLMSGELNGKRNQEDEIRKYQRTIDVLLNYGADVEIWKTHDQLNETEQTQFIQKLCVSPAGLVFLARYPSLASYNEKVSSLVKSFKTPKLAVEQYHQAFGYHPIKAKTLPSCCFNAFFSDLSAGQGR